MKTCVIDMEGNSLSEVNIEKKGFANPECTKIWCVATKDRATHEPKLWKQHQLKELKTYLSKFDILVGHNIYGYDLPVLIRLLNISLPTLVVDTLVVSRLMFPDRNDHKLGGNSLEHWGKFLKFPKTEYTGNWKNYCDEMGQYCLNDVMLCERIYEYQLPFILANKSLVRFEHNVSYVLYKQTENGFGYNLELGDSLLKSLILEKLDIEDNMRTIFPDKIHVRYSEKTGKRLKDKVEVFNPGSRTQIADRLTDKYGWIPPTTEKGNPKVDEEVLSSLDYEEAKNLVKYFDTIKLIGQVEDWNLRASTSRDKRIHGSINPQGAATGRCTHSQPNIAQVSSDPRIRDLWLPSLAGCIQVGSDLKGLELRMLAHYMAKYDNGDYASILVNGDIHKHNQEAAGLLSRDLAKSFIYAYLYGASNPKLSKVLGCSVSNADRLRKKFQKEIPALNKVQEEVRFQFLKHKSVILPDGRHIPVRKEHAALNTLLQGSGAVVSKLWMVLANKDITDKYGDTVKQMAYIHDELQFSAPKEVADDVGLILKNAANKAGIELKLNVPIDADYTIGLTWKDTH
jgi:DNA polymerase I-like protein with 3'-5' exonuclease and polymerase domains